MQFSFAQEKTITGVVTENGMPLPGVSVLVKGTSVGTQTDFDGKYSIKASTGQVLEFSYLGFKAQSKTVTASNTINAAMAADDATELGEVVVVGYGTTTKEAYVGTATKIKAENLEAKTVSNISQALKGEVAGVNVITTSGQPGTDATIRIRGFGSVNGSRAPLYVVDGVPYVGDISSLNPADTESITILKDATATAVYGSRGANGVVVIVTKRGKAGKSTIEVDFKTSFNQALLPRYSVITSPEEYVGLSWQSVRNRAQLNGVTDPVNFANNNLFGGSGFHPGYNMWNTPGDQLIDPATGQIAAGVTRKYTPESWEDVGFQTAYRQETNVQFSGGNDKTRYASTFGYVDDQGYIVNSNYRRYSTRLNLEHTPKDWLKLGANIGYSASRYSTNGQSSDSGSIFWFVDNIPSIYPVYLRDNTGALVADPIYGGSQFDYGDGLAGRPERRFGGLTNSIGDATYDMNRDYVHSLNGNFSFDLKLTDALHFESRYGFQLENTEQNARNNPFYGSAATQFGSLFKQVDNTVNQNFLQLLRYNKSFGNHGVEAFVAHESTEFTGKYFSAGKFNAIQWDTFDLDQYTIASGKPSSYTQGYSLESYFGQVSYNYAQKYYVTGSVRRDGSSRFRNDKWGTFGSIGASWIISKESFLSDSKFLDYFKIKGSYGVVGDQGLRVRYGWQIYSIEAPDEYSFIESTEQRNPNLTWETSKIAQVGFESTWFNMLDVNVDYYVKNTDNLFFAQQLAPSTGYVQTFVNDGSLRNSGLEFDINARLIKAKNEGDFKFSVSVNGELLSNKITEMPLEASGKRKVIDGQISKGHSIYDYFMREWAGVNPATGAALWNMYYDDKNGDGVFDAGDSAIGNMAIYMDANPNAVVEKTTTSNFAQSTQKYVGKSAIPTVRGAFRLNASYKNFDITAQFGYSLGGYSYDNVYAGLMGNAAIGSNNFHTDIRDRWQQPGDITNVPRMTDGLSSDANWNSVSTRFLTKSDYISLNNVQLGYTFPARFLEGMKLSKLNLFASGDNLAFISARKGFNPTTSENGNNNTYTYSPLSTLSFGVRVEF